uniref:Uncharacterized protein n=1 Tax=Rhizophora mucronata TaxID=61149 RepID=A0A2P2Q5B4_RHIMU
MLSRLLYYQCATTHNF